MFGLLGNTGRCCLWPKTYVSSLPPFEIKKSRIPKRILVTGHRRENVGKPFDNLCNQLERISEKIDSKLFSFAFLNQN